MIGSVKLRIGFLVVSLRGQGKKLAAYFSGFPAGFPGPAAALRCEHKRQPAIRITLVPGEYRLSGRCWPLFSASNPRAGSVDWSLFRVPGGVLYRCGNRPVPFCALLSGSDFSRVRVYAGRSTRRYPDIAAAVIGHLLQVVIARYLAVHRLGLILHAGAVVGKHGRCCVFAGISGAGKSALCRVLEGNLRLRIIADDRVMVRRARAGYVAYGCPWSQSQQVSSPAPVPVHALVVLDRCGAQGFSPLPDAEAFQRFYPAVILPGVEVGPLKWQTSFLLGMLTALSARRFRLSATAIIPLQEFSRML